MRWSAVVLLIWFTSTIALAQEGMLQADFRRESERVSDACKSFSFKAVPGCAIELFTDHPLHIAAGSIAPQDGFGLGGAFVADKNTKNWRLSWDVDGIVSTNKSWRTGAYMKMVHTPVIVIKPIIPTTNGSAPAKKPTKSKLTVHPYTVFDLYAQSISLNKINFFGLGNDSTLAGASVFSMTQTIIGGSVIKPVFELPAINKLKLSLLGEANGRFINIRGDSGQSVPSIGTLYTDATAPGLSNQPGFLQLGEGFRIEPTITSRFGLNYLVKFQEFVAPSNSQNSFERWTIDLNHTLDLYSHTQDANGTNMTGPDECAPNGQDCPKVPYSLNLNGSIGFRLLVSESINSATSAVPFYFQPTLGGSDIDGAMSLGSYQDYRFRGPNLLLMEQSFEHSIWGPFGFKLMADEGKVAVTRGDVGFDNLKHSFATGITLRAGGFPMVSLLFAWGGNEGHHNIFNMNTSLLGGSARPSLY